MLCAAACYSTVGRTVYEPLTIVGNDGEAYPYLLESITPNDDSTVWTLVVRDGITFHDGTAARTPTPSPSTSSATRNVGARRPGRAARSRRSRPTAP